MNIFVDTENAKVMSTIIDNVEYKYFTKSGVTKIYYLKNGLSYDIETDISLENAFKEIRNIK